MKHLKKFENFYLNDENLRMEDDDRNRDEFQGIISREEDECETCEDDEDESGREPKNWGDDSSEGDGDYPSRLEEKKSAKDKEDSGLTPKQKKLPLALQKAILKRKKSKK